MKPNFISLYVGGKGTYPIGYRKNYSDVHIKSSFSKNVTYLQYELQKELSKIRQLESKTNFLQSKLRNSRSRKTPKHIIFAETCGEMTELHCLYTEKTQLNGTISSDLCADDICIQQCNAYKELSERLERAKQLKCILRQHEAKKALMANLNKRGYKTVFKASMAAPPIYEFEHIRDR
ncbi:U3 small nucleolar RNA-associated protein 11 [Schistosoma japonicum]|nr:U3 small nucleolar RNA-associated protein 11 [Schistosoma japonicum]